MLRQVGQARQRGAHGGQLEVAQQPDLVGLGEPAHGAAGGRPAEARQRLGADRRAGERADRLVHGVHDVVVERVPDALLAPARALLAAPPRVQQSGELLDHAAGHLRREAALARGGALDGSQDRLGRASLHEIPIGARLQHLKHCLAIVARREREHARLGRAALDAAGRGGASAGDVHVEHGDGRLLAHRRRESPARRRRRRRPARAPARRARGSASAARASASSSAISTRMRLRLTPAAVRAPAICQRGSQASTVVPAPGAESTLQAAAAEAHARAHAHEPVAHRLGRLERGRRSRSRRRRCAPHGRRRARAASP